MTLKPRSCAVCGVELVPTVEELERGGRPRKYCSPAHKQRADRRGRLVKRLSHWEARARLLGKLGIADRFAQRAAEIAGTPFNQVHRAST